MDRYTSFDVFMADVVKTSNKVCDLNDLFNVKSDDILNVIEAIIRKGWWIFFAITSILVVGPFIFGGVLASFLLTPAGMIIAAVFGVSTIITMKKLYRDKQLPLAIKSVGEEYKPKYKKIIDITNNKEDLAKKVDILMSEAAISLIEKAKILSKEVKENIITKIEKNIDSL